MRQQFDELGEEASVHVPRQLPAPPIKPAEEAPLRETLLERALTVEMLAVVLLVLLTYWLMVF